MQPESPHEPELLSDLLDRVAEEKLAADLHAIDAAVRRYKRKLAGQGRWTRFEAPEPHS